MDQVHGPDKLQALEVLGLQLGHHGFKIGAIEDIHQDGFNDVVKVVAQGQFIATQLLGPVVEVAPAHPGAHITGGATVCHLLCHFKDVAVVDLDGNPQALAGFFHLFSHFRPVTGIHTDKFQVKRLLTMSLELLEELGQGQGVLTPRNGHGNLVSFFHQLVVFYCPNKTNPKLFTVAFN